MSGYDIPMHWTPEQATAVFEFVEDIREEILAHYQVQIMEYVKEDRSYESYSEEFEDKDIPF